MKRKIILSILAISLVSALIGGVTMAWFTDDTTVNEVHFKAGTVKVDAELPIVNMPPGKITDNVNPGDCATITWNIVNEGTKAAQLRVNLNALWEAAPGIEEELTLDNVYYVPAPDSGWVLYEDTEGVLWLVYPEAVRGTYNADNPEEPLDPEQIPLTVIFGFDLIDTDNKYQGAEFIIGSEGSKVEAIQASNNAPLEVWGDEWEAVLDGTYLPTGLAALYMNYFSPGQPGYDMACYQHFIGGGDNDPPPVDDKKYQLKVEAVGREGKLVKSDQQGASNFASSFTINNLRAGDEVELTAKAEGPPSFIEWQYHNGTQWVSLSSSNPFDFTVNYSYVKNPDPNSQNQEISIRALYGSPR